MRQYEIEYDNFKGSKSKRIERADDEGAALGLVLDLAGDIAIESTFVVRRIKRGKQQ